MIQAGELRNDVDNGDTGEGEVQPEWIEGDLKGVGNPEVYFEGLNLEKIRNNIRVEHWQSAPDPG